LPAALGEHVPVLLAERLGAAVGVVRGLAVAEEQYRIGTITISNSWFGDPSVKNMQTSRDAYNGGIPYVKYWWFDKS